MQSLTAQYRNESCRALTEKVNRCEVVETLDITINIDGVIKHRDPETMRRINDALTDVREFVLFQDSKNYSMIIPAHRLVVCFMNGVEYERDISQTEKQWMNRIRLAVAGYDNFFELQKKLDGRQENTLCIVR